MEYSDAGSTTSPMGVEPRRPSTTTGDADDLSEEDVDFELAPTCGEHPGAQQIRTTADRSPVPPPQGPAAAIGTPLTAQLKPLRGREDPSTSTDGSVAQPSVSRCGDGRFVGSTGQAALSPLASHIIGLEHIELGNDSVTTYEDDADIAVQMAFKREPLHAHATEGELLAALERTVNQTIEQLDAGRDYEQTELTEAIVKRRLQKQTAVAGGLTGGSMAQPDGDEALARRLAEERLPPLIGPIDGLYPGGEFSFDTDTEAGEDFYRPASTNASGGIRPYRPGEADVSSPPASPAALPPGVATARFAAIQAKCRVALWKGYRSGRSYVCWCLVVPLLYALCIAIVFRFAGGQVCGGICTCTVEDHAQYLFTYGWATRVVPTSVFFTYLVHVLIYAQQRQVLESGGALDADVARSSGAQAMMALSRRRQNQRDNVASKKRIRREALATLRVATNNYNDAKHNNENVASGDGTARMEVVAGNGAQQGGGGSPVGAPPQTTTIPWDVPSFAFCVQQRSFGILTSTMVVLSSAAQFSPLMDLPALTVVPIEACAIVLPTIAACFYFRVPQAVYPLVLLELLPMAAYFVEPRLKLSYQVFHCLWPFLVCAVERLFFYLFFFAAPTSLPVGARVAATTMIGFTSHVLILMASMFLSPVDSPSILTAICVQVFLYELLLGTVVLDRIGIYFKAQYDFRYHGRKSKPVALETTDLRCVGTQTRWCSQLMASVSAGAIWFWRRWPRSVEGGLACGTGTLSEHTVHGGAVAACFAAFAAAALLTAIIRRRNGCLRAPLMVRGRGFPLSMSVYLFMTSFTALAAGAYHGPYV